LSQSIDSSWKASDVLLPREARFVEAILREFGCEPWAEQLLSDIAHHGGLISENKARFFELRFGYALHQAGIVPGYEVAGEGSSTLDFGFTSSGESWLVEMMRLEETEASRSATRSTVDANGVVWTEHTLSTPPSDPTRSKSAPKQSEEGETLKAVQRICQKCERNGRPHKFPLPDGGLHVLLVDFRTFQDGDADEQDMIHVGLGGEYLAEQTHRRYWEDRVISGVFSPSTVVRGADHARARVHFLGFVNEGRYVNGEFASATLFVPNPFLFGNVDEVRAAISKWPLQPVAIYVPTVRYLDYIIPMN
jgi:hypothetical protein